VQGTKNLLLCRHSPDGVTSPTRVFGSAILIFKQFGRKFHNVNPDLMRKVLRW